MILCSRTPLSLKHPETTALQAHHSTFISALSHQERIDVSARERRLSEIVPKVELDSLPKVPAFPTAAAITSERPKLACGIFQLHQRQSTIQIESR